MDYYGLMKSFLMAIVLAGAAAAHAQAPQAAETAPSDTPAQSALDGELFFQLLLGEMQVRAGEPGAGYSLLLDAARKSRDAQLFQRAVDIALQSRSGDAAVAAARAWRQALPDSRDASRYLLQILVALGRLDDLPGLIREEVAATGAADRPALIAGLPRLLQRVGDKPKAVQALRDGLGPALLDRLTAGPAWTAIGRLQLMAADPAGALESASQAVAADDGAIGPVLLAIELIDPARPAAEQLVRRHLDRNPVPELRMAYARVLIEASRYSEARTEVERVTRDSPDAAEAWLVLGSLQAQDNEADRAEASLRRFLELAARVPGEEATRARTQAYLVLAQVAQKRKDFAAAEQWLARIDDGADLISVQARRASILAQQGRIDDARRLVRAAPERGPADARAKLATEIQLLREHKRMEVAWQVLAEAVERFPEDTDFRYDQAMVAEKLGRLDEMERILRDIMQRWPNFHHAFNALGYSLADRNQRLPEARALIVRALELAPGDPFITDSLGWVEFRMGNLREAERILRQAYGSRPDAEIGAHLGEVLWQLGDRDGAQAIWREALRQAPDNETLQETLKRLRVRLRP